MYSRASTYTPQRTQAGDKMLRMVMQLVLRRPSTEGSHIRIVAVGEDPDLEAAQGVWQQVGGPEDFGGLFGGPGMVRRAVEAVDKHDTDPLAG